MGRKLGMGAGWAVVVAAGILLRAAPLLAAPPALPAEVEAALVRAEVPAESLVVLVQEVGSKRPRLAWQGDQPVNPASLMKLFTTVAALDLLGPGWSWTTPVWLNGPVDRGALQGDLVIKGGGDPKLVLERLWLLLRRVRQLGVDEIQGDIVVDRSAFSLPPHDPGGFDAEPLRPYNVGADALLLNYGSVVYTFTPDPAQGVARIGAEPPLAGVQVTPAAVPLSAGVCADWRSALRADFSAPTQVRFDGAFASSCGERSWAVAYPDARRYPERALAGLWQEMGGRLTGEVREGAAPALAPTFELSSPPLSEVVREINKFSNNVMAQQLFLTLGLTQQGRGTPEAARDVLRRWMNTRLGRDAGAVSIDNGSGLSRDSRASAQSIMRLLQLAWASPAMPELLSSLPVSGIDGTLRRSTSAAGRAHLKTGSLRDVAGIAGYVLSDTGRRYALVAIVNHAQANAARPALDALVQWTARDGAPPTDQVNWRTSNR